MLAYANENNGAILGNAWTSGAFLKRQGANYSDVNCPQVCQTWDWTAPVAKMMGVRFDDGGSLASRTARFDYLCRFAGFQCPENDILAPPYSSSPIQITTQMLSYNTACMFQYAFGNGEVSKFQSYIDTGSYRPKVTQVGDSAKKIFIADGARWQNGTSGPPDTNLGWDNSGTSPGGHYADYGPWSQYSRAYLTPSCIVYAMRHGNRTPGSQLSSYRFNVAYFDGHAETLDGRTGMDPNLWLPRGAVLPASECTTDAQNFYPNAISAPIP